MKSRARVSKTRKGLLVGSAGQFCIVPHLALTSAAIRCSCGTITSRLATSKGFQIALISSIIKCGAWALCLIEQFLLPCQGRGGMLRSSVFRFGFRIRRLGLSSTLFLRTFFFLLAPLRLFQQLLLPSQGRSCLMSRRSAHTSIIGISHLVPL